MGCCVSFQPDPDAQPVEIDALHGRYWMVSTCLDMWKPDKAICPSMIWTRLPPTKKGQAYHRDVTEYRTGTLENPSEIKIYDGQNTTTDCYMREPVLDF
jgi:hypothetical protein